MTMVEERNAYPHGGHLRAIAAEAGVPVEQVLDFSASINPLGFPDWVRSLVSASLSAAAHYPDPHAESFVRAVERVTGVPGECIVAGNGSTEIWRALARVCGRTRVLLAAPSYQDYADAARLAGLEIESVRLDESVGFALDWNALVERLRGDELVILGHPNNPTGRKLDPAAVRASAGDHPDSLFCVDEAFLDFVPDASSAWSDRLENLAVVSSLTKIFALPGLRIGWLAANPELAGRVRGEIPPWSMNALAQVIGEAAMADRKFIDRSRQFVAERRVGMEAALRGFDAITVFPSDANFLLCRIESGRMTADELRLALLRDRESEQRVAIRSCSNFTGLDDRYFRVAVRSAQENEILFRGLERAIQRPARALPRRKTPALMIQGTGSHAGKSLITAALCRVLLQDGCRVAPFKSQNMSLNSYVTRDGGEMGRAQVVQAQASRLDPDVRMNPILLKPMGANGSQVIVMGRPVGMMTVDSYIEFKNRAFAEARNAYDELADQNDVMVIEGAGSPAEVNLKRHDIANMAMARHADASVLLVGDIDRGGVFASFIGTMEVLDESERVMVKGFIVNKFRGQENLLEDAFTYTRRHTGRDVLGVIPFLEGLNIPEEDSVGHKSGTFDRYEGRETCVDLALIDLPHISNHSDFDSFRVEDDVTLRVVRSASDLGEPDAILLPGSRNVPGDLEHLRAACLDAAIRSARERGCEIVGICAGMQMLGRELKDPFAMESAAVSVRGLGLLDLVTTLEREKKLIRVRAHHTAGAEIIGYEIHHGRTESSDRPCIFELSEISRLRPCELGYESADGRVWGTYVHGVFDADGFRRFFIDRLRARKGLPPLGRTASYDLEPAIDRLADTVRKSLRMDEIRRLLKL